MLFMGQRCWPAIRGQQPARLESREHLLERRELLSRLSRLRCNLDGVSLGFTGPNISWHVVDNTAKVPAFHRWGAGANDQVMVVMNFPTRRSRTTTSVVFRQRKLVCKPQPDWPVYGADFENKGGGMVTVSGSSARFTLGRYSVQILSRRAGAAESGCGWRWFAQRLGSRNISAIPPVPSPSGGRRPRRATNLQEQAADTNPNAAGSVFKFTNLQTGNGQVTLTWTGGQAVRQVLKQASSVERTVDGDLYQQSAHRHHEHDHPRTADFVYAFYRLETAP